MPGLFDNMLFVWLVLLIVFIVVELATMGLTTIWFAGGALLAAVSAVLHAPLVVQVALFLVVSRIIETAGPPTGSLFSTSFCLP